MGLNLRIENESQLPDGGALDYRLEGRRGADIGRDAHLDWTLPDRSRTISGKHCEIRYKDGSYWLTDVSSNGTYLNGSDNRMQSPHRLRTGDRLAIGHYLITVEVDAESPKTPSEPASPAAPDLMGDDPWGNIEGAAPPADPRAFRPPSQSRPVRPDFLEWAVNIPDSPGVGFVARPGFDAPAPTPASREEPLLDWAVDTAREAPPPEARAPMPTPRRSIWVSAGPSAPWDSGAAPSDGSPPVDEAPPPAPRRPTPQQPPTPAADQAREVDAFLRHFTSSAGLPDGFLAGADAGEMGARLGGLMRLVVENLKQLLEARSQTKRIARSANQTMVQALDNNPLKFSPTAADALRIMMGPATTSYLAADKALQQGFDDVKAHQVKTFTAMQQALRMLVEDLDPKTIETSARDGGAWGGLLGSQRARLWDLYVARWDARTARHEGGALDVFMQYFAECYDRAPTPGQR